MTLLEQLAAGEAPPLRPITVEDYHQMIRTGIIPEGAPVELIDGLLVWKDRSARGADPTSHDPRHALSVHRLQRLGRGLEPHDCHLRSQLPVTLTDTSEPEPDGAVIKGPAESFLERHPGPADILAAMEIAHSSLRFDRTTKQRKYATAGIGQYWIINLSENQIEVYEEPLVAEGRYARRTDYRRGDTIRLVLAPSVSLEISVSDVLP